MARWTTASYKRAQCAHSSCWACGRTIRLRTRRSQSFPVGSGYVVRGGDEFGDNEQRLPSWIQQGYSFEGFPRSAPDVGEDDVGLTNEQGESAAIGPKFFFGKHARVGNPKEAGGVLATLLENLVRIEAVLGQVEAANGGVNHEAANGGVNHGGQEIE